MSFIYDYSQLTQTKYSTLSREMDSYHENESSSTSNQRQTKSSFVEHSNMNAASNAEFNTSNNHFDCLINDVVDGVHVDTMSNEAKAEDDIISMATRYESFLTNDPISRSHNIPNENTMQLNYTNSNNNPNNNHNNNYNNYMNEKNVKFSNEFLNTLNKFQYVLMAPTSPAVKSNEETLTYLNQGQNYELRLNRFNNGNLPNNTNYSHHADPSQPNYNYNQNDARHTVEDVKPLLINGKISRNETNTTNNATNLDKMRVFSNPNENPTIVYLSIVRLCFWDRKLQEVELEEIREWEKEYNNLRMLEIDNNSSFGIIEVRLSEVYTNAAEIIWNGKTGASIFFRCNCTSTAFAPHKHGGEKGIHMRLQIDTYDLSNNSNNNNLNQFYQNLTTNNLTINTVTSSDSYHSSSILSPPNSSSSPVSNKFVKDDLEFNSTSSEFGSQQKIFQQSINVNNWRHVCSSYCRIQLFRLKGAQRKLKTDRSKIERLNPPDLRKRYQPSNKITMLYNCPYDQLFSLLPFNNHNHTQQIINHNDNTGSSNNDSHQCDFNSLYMNPISNNNLSQINSNTRAAYPNYGIGMVSTPYVTNPNEYLSYNNEALTNSLSGTDERHHFYYDQNLASLNSYNTNQTLINKSIKENSLHEMVSASSSSIQPSYHDLGNVTASTNISYQNEDHFRYKRKSSINNSSSNLYTLNNNCGSKYKMAKLNETTSAGYVSSSSNSINKTPPPSNVSSSPSSPALSPSNVNFSNQYQNQYSTNVSANTTNLTNINSSLIGSSSSLNYPLAHDCNNKYVQEWLINNRFCHLIHLFTSYTSNDFLRLSKEDMINLCGAPDGIRCFNMAHNIQIRPKLTIFITFQSQTYFSAIFLADWKSKFLIHKIFNHYYQFLVSLPNGDNKNLKQLHLQKDDEKLVDENNTTNNNNNNATSNKIDKTNSQKESEQIESSKSDDNNNNNNKVNETQNESDNLKNCENYIIDESHYKFYELIKNSSFDYELFLKVKDILVKTSDEVLNNFQDQSRFMIEFELPSNQTMKHSTSSQNVSNISIMNKTSSKSDSNLSNQTSINKTKINNIVKIIMIPLD